MSTPTLINLLLLLFATASCNAQPTGKKPPVSQNKPAPSNPTRTMEKFDFEDFNRRTATNFDGHVFTLPNGNKIEMMDGEEPFIRETPPPPSFEVLYKEFYANGMLKFKGPMVGPLLKVGLWQYYSPDGTLQREVNESARFGPIGLSEVLHILQKEGHIDLKTGKGRSTLVLNYERSNSVLDGKDHNGKWLVELTEGARNEPPFQSVGEPSVYKSLFLEIDGGTGKILKQETD